VTKEINTAVGLCHCFAFFNLAKNWFSSVKLFVNVLGLFHSIKQIQCMSAAEVCEKGIEIILV